MADSGLRKPDGRKGYVRFDAGHAGEENGREAIKSILMPDPNTSGASDGLRNAYFSLRGTFVSGQP